MWKNGQLVDEDHASNTVQTSPISSAVAAAHGQRPSEEETDFQTLNAQVSKMNEQNQGFVKPVIELSRDGTQVRLRIEDGESFDKEKFCVQLRAITKLLSENNLTINYADQTKLCQAFGLPSNIYSDKLTDFDDAADRMVTMLENDRHPITTTVSNTVITQSGESAGQATADADAFIAREFSSLSYSTPEEGA